METKKRRPRFTKEELEVLCEEVGDNKLLLFGKFSDTVSLQRKKKCWSSITSRVNAISTVTRSVDEIRRKWFDWSSNVKVKGAKKAKSMTKTGGGSDHTPDISFLEEKVLGILGKAAVDGIEGGLDSATSAITIDIGNDTTPETEFDVTSGLAPIATNSCQSFIQSADPKTIKRDASAPPATETIKRDASAPPATETIERDASAPPATETIKCDASAPPATETIERDASAPPATETSKRDASAPPVRATEAKRQKTSKNVIEEDVLAIEKARLQIEKERLDVEKARLEIEVSRSQKEDRIISLLEKLVSAKDPQPPNEAQIDQSYFTSL